MNECERECEVYYPEAVTDLIARAILAERERCAKIADEIAIEEDDVPDDGAWVARKIARSIRDGHYPS
jgi:hypothetical protein